LNKQKRPPVIDRGILQVGIIAQRHSRTQNSNATDGKNAKMPKTINLRIFAANYEYLLPVNNLLVAKILYAQGRVYS
jgi:hypothetical protein